MGVVVLKFGGTSMGSVERIANAAAIVKAEFDKGNKPVVVVSAMSGTTDSLISLARSFSDLKAENQLVEYDTILSTGETISSGLMSLALSSLNLHSISLQGWQLPIKTNNKHSKAFISSISDNNLKNIINSNIIPVITGFQGINDNNRITTLGRGGSDTTAVAIAAAINADKCDIYTDVDGIYTADPRIIPLAKKLDKISFDEMIEMASLGSKVLQVRSVTIAKDYNVKLNVLSSFAKKPGTSITSEYSNNMENNNIRGISIVNNESRVSLKNFKNDYISRLYNLFSEKSVTVDFIEMNENCFEFNIPSNELTLINDEIKSNFHDIEVNTQKSIVKISLIGLAIKSNPSNMVILFEEAKKLNIKILKLLSSEMKISFIVSIENVEQFVRNLHTAYGLDVAIDK